MHDPRYLREQKDEVRAGVLKKAGAVPPQLEVIATTRPYAALEAKGARLAAGLAAACAEAGVAGTVTRVGSMGTLFFLEGEAADFAAVKRADTARFARFHAAMLERGVHLPPSQFEAWFLSTAHADADIDLVIAAAREALRAVATVGT